MAKLTYLFGAGASAESLPIVKDMRPRIEETISILKSNSLRADAYFAHDAKNTRSKHSFKDQLIEDLDWLKSCCERQATVDTVSKRLWLKTEYSEVNRLKIALSAFFAIQQLAHPPDMRYDSFFASILTASNRMPKNIRVVSWNYDFQFEIAYSEYSKGQTIKDMREELNVIAKEENDGNEYDRFAIYKLNGTASIYDERNRPHEILAKYERGVNIKHIEEIVENYSYHRNLAHPKLSLSFAWERNGNKFRENIIKDISTSSYLVIIGYSFPFFNRDVDMSILNSMKELKKVYIQSPEGTTIEQKFRATYTHNPNIEVELVTYIDQFILPPELDLTPF